MRTPDGYHSCDRCGVTGLRSVFRSGGGSDLCGDCHAFTDAPKNGPRGKFDGPMVFHGTVPGGTCPTVSPGGVFDLRPPQSEFLPVSATVWARVDCVDFVEMFVNAPGMRVNARNGRFDVDAEYVAAWLDRLGIPWTDDLRKAHEAGTKKGGEA